MYVQLPKGTLRLIPPVSGRSITRRGFSFFGGLMSDRAVVLIDGNNWYHYMKEAGVDNRLSLDYAKISKKLLGPREWIGTRYYIGRVDQRQGHTIYASQRQFVALLEQTDSRISVHFGRIEPRPTENNAAKELQHYLHGLSIKIDPSVFRDLVALAKKYDNVVAWVEKAVDVNLAVDMVAMATRNEYDAVYLLSADGDFTSAVEFVRSLNKKVYVATPGHGFEIAKVANSFIQLPAAWFNNCYK